MKKFILLFFTLLPLLSSAQGIKFTEGDWASIKAKAKSENKMIFADCYTSWCGPCKWMVKNVFPNDTVGSFYNANFICVSFDMEKGEGPEMAKLFDVWCYPTFIYTDSDGNVLHRKSGGSPVKGIIETGREAITPADRYAHYNEKYKAGEITKQELLTYIEMRQGSCLGISEEKTLFLSMKGGKGDTLDWYFIKKYGVELHSKEFNAIIAGRDSLGKQHGEKEVNSIIINAYALAMDNSLYGNEGMDTAKYLTFRSELVALNIPYTKPMIYNFDIGFYVNTQDWKKLAATAKEYVEDLPKDENEHMELNNLAWLFYQSINNDEDLKTALGWAKRSVELNPKYFNTDTYAALLYKLGRKKEAQKAANEAIELAKKEGADYTGTAELLEEINKLK